MQTEPTLPFPLNSIFQTPDVEE